MRQRLDPTPVLVVSCDAYADLWRPFFEVFWRRWPDCPFPVYLGSNHLRYDDDRVTTIGVGDDRSWADGVRHMLDGIDSEYVIFFLEDFLLLRQVDTARIRRMLDLAIRNRVGCLRLTRYSAPFDLPSLPVPGSDEVGRVAEGHPYRVSAQVAVWRTDVLRSLLAPGFSPWDFEMLGSPLSERLGEAFWEVRSTAIHYDHAVEKGRWKPEGVAICEAAGVSIDASARGMFSTAELESHFRQAEPGLARFASHSITMEHFRQGRRLEGARAALAAVGSEPLRLKIWAVLLFGIMGPRAVHWLENANLRWKIARIGLRRRQSA
jgi:hypothetical protein